MDAVCSSGCGLSNQPQSVVSSRLLKWAGWYNLLWGAWVLLFPNHFFHLSGMAVPRYPQLWQCIGMIVGVYGLGYLIASADPIRHWPIILVGFLGKLLGPLGFLFSLWRGDWPLNAAWLILMNDLIWLPGFAVLLWNAIHAHSAPVRLEPEKEKQLVAELVEPLLLRSSRRPLLLVFIRHLGCIYCRETLSLLAEQRASIEARGFEIVLVSMSEPQRAAASYADFGLQDLAAINDPGARLYQHLGFPRGGFSQLFGLRAWKRLIPVGLRLGFHVSAPEGDGLQLGGAVTLHEGRVRQRYITASVADQPDFDALTRESSRFSDSFQAAL